jgi:hypothetical protein
MTRGSFRVRHQWFRAAWASAFLVAVFLATAAEIGRAQAGPYERTYRQSKSAVERALKELQPGMSGRLPALEGFAAPGEHPLSRYQRAYYQTAVQVSSAPSGGALVRVSAKVTAWYADASPSHSGYQLLTSNGRIESDFLDQLTDLLASGPAAASEGGNPGKSSSETFPAIAASAGNKRSAVAEKGITGRETGESAVAAPMPRLPDTGHTFPATLEHGLSGQQLADTKKALKPLSQPASGLQAEAASLEEVLKNQAHPKNLVAIKKPGTPVVATPSLNGKTLFLASAQDEFEMLDFNADWVHVRISGLSRGWIWRTSLEMPEGISDVPTNVASAKPVAADLFQVTREETAPFPGDWEPLRGKNVRIISVQKIQESEKDSGAQAKLEFAKSLLDKNYADLAANSREVAGVVLIFDSVDGGMIAATLPTVQQWKAGTLSDSALWHQCYFDPPETFSIASPSGGL